MAAKLPPPAHTPLVSLPVLVLDMEATGLDVRNDRVVQVAGIALSGAETEPGPPLDLLVDPGVPIPPTATRVHGIGDADVAGAGPFADAAARLDRMLAGRVVIGHHVGYDLGLLRFEYGRSGLAWHEPPRLDVAMLFGALHPEIPELSLETVAANLDVTVDGRHNALGDCRAAADIWARLLPLLRKADVRTLGEAQVLAERRSDLLMHQMQMGWFDEPGGLRKAQHDVVHGRIDSYAFQSRLGDLMSSPPRTIADGATLRDAATAMVDQRIGALLIGDSGCPPDGILTERDLLRATADRSIDLDATPVSRVMSSPVESMPAGEMLYRALARMDRLGIRHVCIVDRTGCAIGMVSQRDLLHHRARGVELVDDAFDAAEDLPALAAAYARMPDIAGKLLSEELDGVEIARVVSNELCTLTARAAELTVARLEAEGRGPAPAPWCLLVLGSGGRGESLLGADQDNALIHTGGDADDAWFAALGEGVADLLDHAGVRRCEGDVMAASSAWRGSREAWAERIGTWMHRANPDDLLSTDIFFDLTPVAGDPDLARELHDGAVRAISDSTMFLGFLAQMVDRFAPRLGMFGGPRLSDGRVDLKRDGLLSLTGLARTVALRVGSTARATPERLRDAVAAGRLPPGDAEALIELHTLLLTLILRQQLADLREGVRPSSRVEYKALGRDERADLKTGLKRLDGVIKELRSLVA